MLITCTDPVRIKIPVEGLAPQGHTHFYIPLSLKIGKKLLSQIVSETK